MIVLSSRFDSNALIFILIILLSKMTTERRPSIDFAFLD